jgi:hypothetical protein
MARLFTHAPEKEPADGDALTICDSDSSDLSDGEISNSDSDDIEGTLYAHFYTIRSKNVSKG